MSPRLAQASRGQSGFTLIEVMLALLILAFGILMLALMQLYAMRQGSQGRHTGDGTAIARSYLEQATRLSWTALDAAEAAGTWVAPGWAGAPPAQVVVARPNGAATTEHAYTIEWKVTDVGGPPVCLRDVEVRVSWGEDDSSAAKSHVLGTRRFNVGSPDC
jgi:prepilin-type N-terminal cleavage/methylation domain-containing protein